MIKEAANIKIKDRPNTVRAKLIIDVEGEFYDDESTAETLRYCVEQDLEDAGFNVIDSEVFDLANKAIEQQPCEDCVSREAVEKITWEEPSYDDALNVLTEVRDKVRALSSVTPQQRWIPVSERLPEDYIHVLCQFTLGGMAECYLAHGAFHVVGGLVMTCNEVIAWMPLPQPYKAESDEQ